MTRRNLLFRIGSSVSSKEMEYLDVQTGALEVWMEYERLSTLGRRAECTRSRAYLCKSSSSPVDPVLMAFL